MWLCILFFCGFQVIFPFEEKEYVCLHGGFHSTPSNLNSSFFCSQHESNCHEKSVGERSSVW
uniref:Calcineurin-like phosphoesterase domain-containing protein n=1 Tax=Anguilla anguilla TaxID=7936 RepID=A0A0E9U9A6_ANGAN